jgi:hypothetical protein
MFKEKKEFLSYIAGLAVILIAGIVIGYYVWGVERKDKPDYTEYLSKAIEYIKSIEKANLVLTEKKVALEDRIASMTEEANDPTKLMEEIDALKKQIAALKNENTSLQSTITENGERLKDAANLQAEHENLLSEVKSLVSQKEALESAVDACKGFVDENDRLKGVIDKLTADLAASKAQIEAVQQLVKPETVIEQPAQ